MNVWKFGKGKIRKVQSVTLSKPQRMFEFMIRHFFLRILLYPFYSCCRIVDVPISTFGFYSNRCVWCFIVSLLMVITIRKNIHPEYWWNRNWFRWLMKREMIRILSNVEVTSQILLICFVILFWWSSVKAEQRKAQFAKFLAIFSIIVEIFIFRWRNFLSQDFSLLISICFMKATIWISSQFMSFPSTFMSELSLKHFIRILVAMLWNTINSVVSLQNKLNAFLQQFNKRSIKKLTNKTRVWVSRRIASSSSS